MLKSIRASSLQVLKLFFTLEVDMNSTPNSEYIDQCLSKGPQSALELRFIKDRI